MDDEDEIQSHSSTASRSPSPYQSPSQSPSQSQSPPPPAAAAAQPPQSVALALPTQQPRAVTASNNGSGREDCWSEGATAVLIDAWGERYLELSRGNLKQKHWKEVADIVSSREDYNKVPKTDVQCKNRIDTVKKKFKQEKAKIVASGGSAGPSSWPFFERLDRLIGSTVKIPVINTPSPVIATSKIKFPGGKIPVRSRSKGKSNVENRNVKLKFRKRGSRREDWSEEEEEEEEDEEGGGWDTDDSLPPVKKPRVVERRGGKGGGRGSSIRMLTQAIVKLGEAYEQAENARLLQVVEMEKSRMKFAKELELQRMQFFVKTQMEISQLRHAGGDGGGSGEGRIESRGRSSGRNRHAKNNIVNVVNNISDSDN